MLDILSTLSHLSDIGDWPEKLEYEPAFPKWRVV